jgi:putative phosphoesterase
LRVAAVADIHSNYHALQAVLDELSRSEVEMVACVGDIVGYGAFPDECCVEVKRIAAYAVRGNHDVSALTGDTLGMNPYAAEAALWTAGRIGEDTARFLHGLGDSASFMAGGTSFAMFHGSPRDPLEYVFEDALTPALVEGVAEDILVLGHTHVPFVSRLGDLTVVNPGSVGQPRDGDPRASFAVIDTSSMDVTIVRRAYDVDAAAEAISRCGLPDSLGQRLRDGR